MAASYNKKDNAIRKAVAQLHAEERAMSYPLCQCGRRSYTDANRESDWQTTQFCPRCDMPCRSCECEDYYPDKEQTQ